MLKVLVATLALIMTLAPIPGKRVHDFAQIISDQNEYILEQRIAELERKTTAQVAVVTVSTLGGEDVDTYTTELFNAWGIGQKNVNNGLMFLIAPHEKRTKIGVGYGLEPLVTDELAGEILDSAVVPAFKEGDFDKGIVDGTNELIDLLLRYPDAARGIANSTPSYVFTPQRLAKILFYCGIVIAVLLWIAGMFIAKSKRYPPVFFFLCISTLLLIFGFALYETLKRTLKQEDIWPLAGSATTGLFAIYYNFRKFRRYRPHFCGKCSTELKLLDDKAEDSKLTTVQILEESLGSVDYDIWACPACLNSEREAYINWMSNYKACPKCKNRCFSETDTIVSYATTISTGLRRWDGECKSCFHTSSRTEIIPRVSKSSSSGGSFSSSGSFGGGGGGGGFGGGSSGGGGASRSW